MYERINLMYS